MGLFSDFWGRKATTFFDQINVNLRDFFFSSVLAMEEETSPPHRPHWINRLRTFVTGNGLDIMGNLGGQTEAGDTDKRKAPRIRGFSGID